MSGTSFGTSSGTFGTSSETFGTSFLELVLKLNSEIKFAGY